MMLKLLVELCYFALQSNLRYVSRSDLSVKDHMAENDIWALNAPLVLL